jgi:aspartate-semialdehyde dehydrogenase
LNPRIRVAKQIDVGLLGATGTVGRELARHLRGHPWFRLAEVGGSSGSAGRSFGEAVAGDSEDPERQFGIDVLSLPLKEAGERWRSPLLLSALPGRVAASLETELAGRGHVVVSNASSHRMDPTVPLIIPEVNPDHLALVEKQGWSGALITNPNCSVAGLAIALAPLQEEFGIEAVMVATLQALSGAGRPGPSAADMMDNVLPYIPGEEEKLTTEPQKILGILEDGEVRPAPFPVSAHAHRVGVAHGHLQAVSVKLARAEGPEEVVAAFAGFRGAIVGQNLPTALEKIIEVLSHETRPQPRLDRDRGGGMTVSVGRVRPCPVFHVRFTVLVHNLVRGAAGAALLNAELCHISGLTERSGLA